jgi:hypothetical protein
MPTLNVECDDLAHLLSAALRPRVERVSCTAQPGRLAIALHGVDPEARILGRALPRIDVVVHLAARLIGERTAEVTWKVASLAGLPAFVQAALPTDRLARGMVVGLIEKRGWGSYVDVGLDRLVAHLDRIGTGPLDASQVVWEALAVPSADGAALSARLRFTTPNA